MSGAASLKTSTARAIACSRATPGRAPLIAPTKRPPVVTAISSPSATRTARYTRIRSVERLETARSRPMIRTSTRALSSSAATALPTSSNTLVSRPSLMMVPSSSRSMKRTRVAPRLLRTRASKRANKRPLYSRPSSGDTGLVSSSNGQMATRRGARSDRESARPDRSCPASSSNGAFSVAARSDPAPATASAAASKSAIRTRGIDRVKLTH